MRTRIENVTLVTTDEANHLYPQGCLVIEDDTILALNDFDLEVDEVIDGKQGLLLPGMINTHCHLGMIPFRSLGDDCPDRLRRFLFPLENAALTRELAQPSPRYAAAEMILGGVTTVFDMYYFEDAVAEVMDQMGIRGIAGETVMEEASCDARTPREAIMLGQELIKRYRNHPRIKGCIAPHGTTTCGSSTLQEIHEVNHKYGVPFTLHVAEMDYEMTYLKEQYGCTPIEYLDRLGVLDSHTLCAHSIRLTEQDISLMAKSGSSVAHCIGSNTKAAKGVAPVSFMLEHGMTVGLGTDGPASGNTLDLFTQMRFCANFHKNETGDRSAFPAKDIVSMATIWGAGALGLDPLTGSLEPGKEADLVVVETDSPNMFPVYDPYSALVYSARADNVRHVFVAGRCLVKDKQLVSQDFRQIREDLQQKMNQTAFGGMGNAVLA